MQGGAAPQVSVPVRAWLDKNFTGRWIGNRGPKNWPPRNTDLTVCNLPSLGWMKERMHRSKPGKLYELGTHKGGNLIPVNLGLLRSSASPYRSACGSVCWCCGLC